MKSIATRLFLGTVFLLMSSTAFAGHPAADRVTDILEEAFRIVDMSGSAQKNAMCRFVSRYIDKNSIATQLLGRYNRSSDTNGVREFKREAGSQMVTKAFPKMSDMKGNSGSYSVSDRVTSKPGGKYSVSVTISTNKGKRYSGRAILNSSLDLLDVEYLGFSGVNYVARDIQNDISKYNRSSTPVSDYMDALKSSREFINCN